MSLIIRPNTSGTSYVATGTSVGFPGEYSNRSFMFACKFNITGSFLLGGAGDTLTLWSTDSENVTVAAGFPSMDLDTTCKIELQKMSLNTCRIRVTIGMVDNFPVLASYAATGTYFHKNIIHGDTFSLPIVDPDDYSDARTTGWNHIMFRIRAPEKNTTADGSSQPAFSQQSPGSAVTITTSSGWNTSSTGFDYTQAYLNGTDVWSTIDWTKLEMTSPQKFAPLDSLTRRVHTAWRYASNDADKTTYNKLATFNQGSGSYFTGFRYSRLGGVNTVGSTCILDLDEIWIGDWDSYSGAGAPDISNFWSAGSYVLPTESGTLANGLRAQIYYSSRDDLFNTNKGLLGSSADITERSGNVSINYVLNSAQLAATAGLTTDGWRVYYFDPVTFSSTAIVSATPSKLIKVVIGRYFSDDGYVAPGYVTDDTFNSSSTLTTTARVDFGLIETATAVASLTTSAGVIREVEFGIELVAYALVTTVGNQTFNDIDLVVSAAQLATTAAVTWSGVATLAVVATIDPHYREDWSGEAAISSQASLVTVGSFAAKTIDLADQFNLYTWDSVSAWTSFPDFGTGAAWSRNGQYIDVVTALSTNGGILQSATAQLDVIVTVAAAGTFAVINSAEITLSSAFTATTAGGAVRATGDAIALSSAATLTTTGLRLQEIVSSLFGVCALDTTATVTWSGAAVVASVLSADILGGIKWLTPQATISAVATVATLGGYKFVNPQVNMSAVATVVTLGSIPRIDPYRRAIVVAESREITAQSELRLQAVESDLRRFKVYSDTRTLVVPQMSRTVKIPVPSIKQIKPTVERQI